MQMWWRKWLEGRRDEISPGLGVAFGMLYLVAVLGVACAGVHFQRSAVEARYLSDMQRLTQWVSDQLAAAQSAGPAAVRHVVRKAARERGVVSCVITTRDGTVVEHSDPLQVGQQAPALARDSEAQAPVQLATDPAHPERTVMINRIASPIAGATDQEVRLSFAPLSWRWTQSEFVFWAGYILLAILGLYLLLYRILRRSVEPLAVIRNRLVSCTEPVADRLAALRLNDSFDQVSTSWNRIIECVAEMQEELSRRSLSTDVTAAMEGYRSDRLRELLMQIPFGVLVVDGEQRFAFANRAAVGLLGPSESPIEGRSVAEVFEEKLCEDLFASPKCQKAGSAVSSRWVDHDFEGSHSTVTLRFWSNACDTGGNEYVIFVQDVTQAKEAERARDSFLYHVTHEFRTPLTNIRAYAETLSQGVIDDEQTIRECYNVIMGETSRLGRLVEDLLNVSQLEVGTARINKNEVSLSDVLRKVVQDNQGAADEKNIELLMRLPAKMPRLAGDRDRLAVVFNNLLGNAIKYTNPGGQVDVRLNVGDKRVEIAVTDTGMGIDPDNQEKIFEKFYRVDNEQVAAIKGTGLGLAIARETVRVHGGALTVNSTPGKGSTFTVSLPTLPIDGSAPRDPATAASREDT